MYVHVCMYMYVCTCMYVCMYVCTYVRVGYTYLQEGQFVTSSILNVIHVCHLRSSTSACGTETSFLGKMTLRVVCGLDNLEHQVWNSQVLMKLMAGN